MKNNKGMSMPDWAKGFLRFWGNLFFLLVLSELSITAYAQHALEVVELRPNVHMIAGAGANIVVQSGVDGLVVVDSGSGERTDEVLAAIESIGGNQPIRYVINTSAHPDHVGGNEALSAAGEPFAARRNSGLSDGAIIFAQENVLFHMIDLGSPPAAWPVEGYATPSDAPAWLC